KAPCECPKKVKIKLSDGKEREIQHMVSVSFWSADGKPLSLQEFLEEMLGELPAFFKDEDELRKIWSKPDTRKAFLEKIAELGFNRDQLETVQKMIAAEESDLFDVLSYVSFAKKPITREKRVDEARSAIYKGLDEKQQDFLEFVLSKYIDYGVDELSEEKLPKLLNLKYQAIADAEKELGSVDLIRSVFIGFQKFLYGKQVA
ncbi:restriction endonuclease subunit R, partial [Candidatus Peregrinibacteria bacterium CG10_big_fil_rev_8_21_14_0_10_54_7]